MSELKLPAARPAADPAPVSLPLPQANEVLRWRPSPFATAEAPPVAPETFAVELVEGDALEQWEAQWQGLADEAIEPNPFYEPWMAQPAMRQLADQRPFFLLVWAAHPSGRKGERLLCGLIPLVRGPSLPGRGVGAPALWSLWRYGYCYLTAPLLRRGVGREVLAAVLAWMESAPQAGNVLLQLPWLPGDGPVAQALTDTISARGWRWWQSEAFTRALFRPAPLVERFLETAIPGRRRKEWRRLSARLHEQGTVELKELESIEDLRAWTEAFVALEASGWKGRDGVAVAARSEDRAFFEEMCRHALLRSRLQLLALMVNGKPIAMKLNLFAASGAGFAFKIAYDEAWAKYSPGVLLELENISRLHAMPGVPWMDSCAAPNRFMINQLWPERRPVQSLFLAPPGTLAELGLAALPIIRWGRAQVRAVRARLQKERADDQ